MATGESWTVRGLTTVSESTANILESAPTGLIEEVQSTMEADPALTIEEVVTTLTQ